MLDYLVLYQSRSGNTKKIAVTIFSELPGQSKDLIDIDEGGRVPEARVYFIGFGVYNGTCSLEIADLLSSLSGKQIALFATCGKGGSDAYCAGIANTVSAWIESDNDYLGAFICQGKIPLALRKRCEGRRTDKNNAEICAQLREFDMALTHPDDLDIEHAKVFVSRCLKELAELEQQASLPL